MDLLATSNTKLLHSGIAALQEQFAEFYA